MVYVYVYVQQSSPMQESKNVAPGSLCTFPGSSPTLSHFPGSSGCVSGDWYSSPPCPWFHFPRLELFTLNCLPEAEGPPSDIVS